MPHSSVWDPIMRLHKSSLTFTNAFWSYPPGSLLEDFSWFIFLNDSVFYLSLACVGQSFSQHNELFSTVVTSDVIQISPGSLLLLFSVAFVVPSFPALRKHELVTDLVGLGISIRVIIRLIF